MPRQQPLRKRGKLSLSGYFKDLKEGERVAVVREMGQESYFPRIIQGKTGIIAGKRGRSYIVKLNDFNQKKTYLIKAIHLKRIK